MIRAGEEVPDLKKYEAELAADPRNELALYNAGVAAYLSGDFAKAVKYSGQLSALRPTDWLVRSKEIQALSAAGKLEERNAKIEELKKEWNSGTHPELSEKGFFIRDQIVLEDTRVYVLEYYELKGDRALVWKFLPSKEGSEAEPDLIVSLGSYEATTKIARELGEIKPNGRMYHLDGYEPDGGHKTFAMFKKLPDYEKVKELAVKALKGTLKEESSFKPGATEPKAK